jgi:hypothetical protein
VVDAQLHTTTDGIYPQTLTPIVTDNSTAAGIANDTVNQNDPKPSTGDLLDSRSRTGRPIHHLLAQGSEQLRGLFYQAKSNRASH